MYFWNFEFSIPANHQFETSDSLYWLISTMQGAACRCLSYRKAARETSTPTLAAIFNHYLSRDVLLSKLFLRNSLLYSHKATLIPDWWLPGAATVSYNDHWAAFLVIFSAGLEVQSNDLSASGPVPKGWITLESGMQGWHISNVSARTKDT